MRYNVNPNAYCQKRVACKLRKQVIGYTYPVACGVQYPQARQSVYCIVAVQVCSLYQADHATCPLLGKNEKMARAAATGNQNGPYSLTSMYSNDELVP